MNHIVDSHPLIYITNAGVPQLHSADSNVVMRLSDGIKAVAK